MALIVAIFAFVAAFAANIEAANILLVPTANSSHYLEIDGVGRPLLQRGHNVYLLKLEAVDFPKHPYKVITVKSPPYELDSKFEQKRLESADSAQNLTFIHHLFKRICIEMLTDAPLFPTLENLKLDLVIVDNFFVPCFFLIPYKLGVPFVAVGTVLTTWYNRLPLLPSVVQPPFGLDMFGIHFCEESDSQLGIIRRLCRTAAFVMQEVLIRAFETEYLREYVQFPSIDAIRENASLTLVNSNPLLASALPKLPHVEYVGGLTTKPAKPLEAALEHWMSEAPNVIVVSFGSSYGSLPPAMASKIFDAFGRLSSYRFLFRFDKLETAGLIVPSNVRLMDWLPQNDALGHKSTRLFVTHSGNNGQQEALYHGVPMLCFYVHADQRTNALRVTQRGFGKMINIFDFTADQLVAELTELLQNKTYSERIKKASAIFHSEKHPSERAADAVEHVLKYGGEHLRPKEAYKLTWWQFYMLDVLAVIYLAFVVTIVVSWKLALYIGRRVLSRARLSKKAKSD